MSKSKWFSWQELLDRWGLKDHELVERFKDGLQPYKRHGRGRILNHEYYHVYWRLFERHEEIVKSLRGLSDERLEDRKRLKDELAAITKEMEAIVDDDPDFRSWKYLDMHMSSERMDKLIRMLKKEQPIFKRDNVLKIEKMDQQGHIARDTLPAKKLRPNQEHKIKCRAIAKELWQKDRRITIAAMTFKDEINKACDGEVYAERTLRNWIKELCPNRSPGRRPKTS